MSLLKKLFGGARKEAASAEPAVTAEVEYKGFVIKAMPFKDQGQFQTAGLIEKGTGDAVRRHRFVRADRSPSADEVTELALAKGRLMVDQQGESLFD
jgi:hypothetical protein